MKPYLNQLREWFTGLAPRERLMVGACAVFVLFTILYYGIWNTLAGAHTRREKALADSRALATRLEIIGAEVTRARRSGGGAGSVNRSMSLLSAVDQASKSGTLSKPPSRMQPEGDAEVRVWLEDVNFDGLLRWIHELETRYGVTVQTVDIDKESAPGLVNARLSLVRP
jgi:general secretion pathway protein M